MRYRRIGSSDLEVSEISLGSWLTYGGGVGSEQAEACVAKAFEVGINFVDTANVYGRGGAEEFLGQVLADRPRDSYVLATKLFFPMNGERGLSREQVFKQLDSEWPPERIQAAIDLPNVERFVSSQPQYSMLWREPEREVIPLCAANGISQIVWSPLAQGALTGKYTPGKAPPAGSRAASQDMGWAMDRFRDEEVLEAVQRVRPITDGLGITMARLALAWVLREPNVASAIVGASRPEQVEENAGASGVELDDETLRAIDEALVPALA